MHHAEHHVAVAGQVLHQGGVGGWMRDVAVREEQHRQRRAGARRRVNERPGLHLGQVIEGDLRLPHQGGERAGLLHAGAEVGCAAALGAVRCRIPRQDLHLTLLCLVAEGLRAGVVDHGERRRADGEGAAGLRELEGRPRRGGRLRRCLRDHAGGEGDRNQREGDQRRRDRRLPWSDRVARHLRLLPDVIVHADAVDVAQSVAVS